MAIHNLIAAAVAMLTILLMVILAFRTKMLRKGVLLITTGIFFAVGVHAILELLEALGFLEVEQLLYVMPVLVSVGSFMILGGIFYMMRNSTKHVNQLKNSFDNLSMGKSDMELDAELLNLQDEIGDAARAFNRLIISLKLAMKRTEKKEEK
jgi:HAMP domain-containing protein